MSLNKSGGKNNKPDIVGSLLATMVVFSIQISAWNPNASYSTQCSSIHINTHTHTRVIVAC